jgi:hypothetical protein
MTAALAAQLGQRLDGLEMLALFLDGVVVAGQTVIVVLGLTREGEKRPLGLRLGSSVSPQSPPVGAHADRLPRAKL